MLEPAVGLQATSALGARGRGCAPVPSRQHNKETKFLLNHNAGCGTYWRSPQAGFKIRQHNN